MLVLPKGLLEGERLAKCSDEAQLHFPRLAALTNGFGRIELNLRAILETAYRGFSVPPTREQVTGWFKEYAAAHLLFIYRGPDEKPWGQWRGIPDNMLPRFKTSADKRSPVPPTDALAKFDEEYVGLKKASGDFLNVDVDFGNVPKSSEDFGCVPNIAADEVVDEVLDEVVDEGKQILSSDSKPGAEDRKAVERVFAYYLEKLGRSPRQYELTEKRMRKGLAALRECRRRLGDGPKAEEALGAAVDGLLANKWLMGENPGNKRYTDWETYVVKDVETMEKRWNDGGYNPDVHA